MSPALEALARDAAAPVEGLSAAQVARYREKGYLVVEDVISAAELACLRAGVDRFVDESRQVAEHTAVYDLEDDHTPDRPHVRRIKDPDFYDDAFAALIHHRRIVAILETLIGPGVRYDKSKLNMKSGGGGSAVEWHQDWAFYPHTNDDLCAVGVLLDDMTMENGPLLVVPGSHKGPIYDHHHEGAFCGAIGDPALQPTFAKAEPLLGRAGAITIHHVRALHGSAPNLTDGPRRLLLMQMRAADAWPLVERITDMDAFNARLITGEPVVAPRMAEVPVRLPLPPARHQGSIFENQKGLPKGWFAAAQA